MQQGRELHALVPSDCFTYTFKSYRAQLILPSVRGADFALSTPEFMTSESTEAFTVVVKDITKELTAMERLGGMRDLMAKSFRIEGEDHGGPKVQEPRFRYIKSG